MGCRATTSERARAGTTFVEMLVALGVSGLVVTVVVAFMVYNSRSFAALTNWIDMNQSTRRTVDLMTKEIRQALQVVDFAPNAVTLINVDGTALNYSYDPVARTLTRCQYRTNSTEAGITNLLLSQVDGLNFAMMQRNLIEGTYDNYGTTNVSECKLLSVSWRCSRAILGVPVNLGGEQEFRCVIRKQ